MAGAEETVTGPIKAAVEAIKTAVEVFNPEEKEQKGTSRPGPLVVVGRLYISLTVILALVTSACAIIDWKTGQPPSESIVCMRHLLVFAIGMGLVLSVVLIAFLTKQHALYLFSPTEFSQEALHRILGPQTKEEVLGEDAQAAAKPPPKAGSQDK